MIKYQCFLFFLNFHFFHCLKLCIFGVLINNGDYIESKQAAKGIYGVRTETSSLGSV